MATYNLANSQFALTKLTKFKMDKTNFECLALVIVVIVILLFVGFLQDISGGWFFGIVFFLILAFFIGRGTK